jgi:hypothetical protein
MTYVIGPGQGASGHTNGGRESAFPVAANRRRMGFVCQNAKSSASLFLDEGEYGLAGSNILNVAARSRNPRVSSKSRPGSNFSGRDG